MGLQAVGTHKTADKGDAVTLTVDGVRIALKHEDTSLSSEEQIVSALESAASLSSVQLPKVFIHRNRDGSLALATGAAPKVWPEDRSG